MLVKSLLILIIRKGEELKAPRHASAAATRDIFPILAILFLWLPPIYIYRLTSITNINPPYLLLLLQYVIARTNAFKPKKNY